MSSLKFSQSIKSRVFCLVSIFALFGTQSFAVTEVRTLPIGGQVIVTINSASSAGRDGDALALYELLNLPEQNSNQGKGKGYKSKNKEFVISCAKDRLLCSIILNPSSFLKKGPKSNQFVFQSSFEQWPELKEIFKNLNRYETTDRVIFMESDETKYTLKTN